MIAFSFTIAVRLALFSQVISGYVLTCVIKTSFKEKNIIHDGFGFFV